MAKKAKLPKPFTGQWRIVSMSDWYEDYLNEEVEAYIKFDESGLGSFQFGYVQGQMDCRITMREEKPAVEFSWEGGDAADGTPLTGRGWAILDGNDMTGLICIHLGDDSDFVATNAGKLSPKKTRKKA